MFTRFNHSVGRAFVQFNSAVRAAAAVRAGQRPAARDLHTLGINPTDFPKIHD